MVWAIALVVVAILLLVLRDRNRPRAVTARDRAGGAVTVALSLLGLLGWLLVPLAIVALLHPPGSPGRQFSPLGLVLVLTSPFGAVIGVAAAGWTRSAGPPERGRRTCICAALLVGLPALLTVLFLVYERTGPH